MKKFLAAIFAIAIAVSVSACGANTPEEAYEEDVPSRFVIIERASVWDIVVDKDTRVTYAVSNSSYNRGIFTLLVNADGTPLVYEGELQ